MRMNKNHEYLKSFFIVAAVTEKNISRRYFIIIILVICHLLILKTRDTSFWELMLFGEGGTGKCFTDNDVVTLPVKRIVCDRPHIPFFSSDLIVNYLQ